MYSTLGSWPNEIYAGRGTGLGTGTKLRQALKLCLKFYFRGFIIYDCVAFFNSSQNCMYEQGKKLYL